MSRLYRRSHILVVLLTLCLLGGSLPSRAQLAPEGSVNGSLDASHTSDTYSITFVEDGDVTFTLTPSANLRVLLRFLDTDGSTVLLSSTTGGVGQAVSLTLPHLGPGTYFIRAVRVSGDGTYTLSNTIVKPTLANDAEPNDSNALATLRLFPGDSTMGHLGYSRTQYATRDVLDYYKIQASSDGDLTFTVSPTSALRVILRFYNSNGTAQLFASTTGGFGQTVSLTIKHLGPGTDYFVAVDQVDGSGGYTLQVTGAALSLSNDTEVNDTAPSATLVLAPGDTTTGHLGYSRAAYGTIDTLDYFKLRANEDGQLVVIVNPSLDLRVVLRLYDTNGVTQIAASTTGGFGQLVQLSFDNLGPGADYFVTVDHVAGCGEYALQTTWYPELVPNDTETNDTQGTAQDFDTTQQVSGHLGYTRTSNTARDLLDYHKIVWAGGTLTLHLQPAETLRGVLRLYNSGGSQVTSSVTGGFGQAVSLTQSNLAAGTYFAVPDQVGGYGGYSLSVAPPTLVSGTINLLEAVNKVQYLLFEFRPTGEGEVFLRGDWLDAAGNFRVIAIPPGTYEMAIKGSKWLQKIVSVDTSGGAVSGVLADLKPGDANNDNHVDIFDLATLAESFNTIPDDTNWNVQTDFNCDNSIDIFDLATLAAYFNQDGDE